MSHLIAPSLLASDFANLQSECEMINKSDADWYHLDVMDGVFVPNISFGMPVLKSINSSANKPLDVHLMIVNPDHYIKTFAALNAKYLTVHFEVCNHLHRTIQEIKNNNMKAGVALNPHTPVSVLDSIIEDIDLVCLMSVNPGFGGQKFITNTFKKTQELKQLIDSKESKALIEIDGGVTDKNAEKLIENGADVLVAGSFVFKSNNPLETISNLKSITN